MRTLMPEKPGSERDPAHRSGLPIISPKNGAEAQKPVKWGKNGQFQPGPDPRRHGTRVIEFEGVKATLAEHCRLRTPQALGVLLQILDDPNCLPSDRLRAVESLINRGWGKPVESVKVEAEIRGELGIQDYAKMTTAQLMSLFMEQQQRTIEGESKVVPELAEPETPALPPWE